MARNPRTVVLSKLREINASQRATVNRWDVGGWVDSGSPWSGSSGQRPRLPHEYPENDPRAWEALATDMTRLIQEATDIRRMADAHRQALARRKVEEEA